MHVWVLMIYVHVLPALHQNLPPTSQCLEPHIYSAFFNVYIIMHVLDAQMHVKTGDLHPVDYGFTLDNGHLLPSTCWKTLYTNLHVCMWCATAENALV